MTPTTLDKKAAYTGPSAEKIMKERQQFILPSTVTYFKEPLLISRAERQFVYDEKGKKYLDGFAGVVTISVGHCHPEVVKRTQAQLEKLTCATRDPVFARCDVETLW